MLRTLKKIEVKIIILILFLIAISFFVLLRYNNKNSVPSSFNTYNDDNHTIITVKQGEDIVINSNDITTNATYYNYEYDDYIIQIFASKATNEIVRIVFNTCVFCNPSPMAYFIQNGDYFECQNCRNKFHRNEIGLTETFGCSPIAVLDENKMIKGSDIIISNDFVETYKDKFETINIFEN